MKFKASAEKLIQLFDKLFIYFLIAIILIILGIGYMVFIQEKVAEIQKVGTVDLDSKINVQNSAQRNLNLLQDLSEKYNKVSQEELLKLAKVLPRESELPFLSIELDKFVTENGLILNSIDIGAFSGSSVSLAYSDTAPIKELNISLSIEGIESYLQLKSFLQAMSEELPLIELSSLTYNDELTTYNLNLTTYYQ